MTVIERQAQQIEAQRLNKGGVRFGEEIFEGTVKEKYEFFLAQRLTDSLTLSFFVGRVAGDKVFHIHPAAQAKAAQAGTL
jgi:hypothetical protein